MASSNTPSFEPVIAGIRRAARRLRTTCEPVLTPTYRAGRFVTSSVFRSLILFGIVLLVLGATVIEGILAGHFGIYGATAIFVGVLGRLVIRWKLKDSA